MLRYFLLLLIMGWGLCLKPLQAQLRINELLCANSSITYDNDFGEFSDFIELYNASGTAIQLYNYSITDDAENPEKWRLPAIVLPPQSYLIIWADDRDKRTGDVTFSEHQNANIVVAGLHANFKLSSSGGYVGLYNNQGILVDEQILGVQVNDVSYGRNAGGQWFFMGEPSPNASNSIFGNALLDFATEPQFSLTEGFYPAPLPLQITSAGGAVVRYTIDGSTPNETSPIFSGNFDLIRTYTIKARVYEAGKLPSAIVTKTYFIAENIDLPVVALSGNNAHFYDFDFGILQNAIKDREVPITVEYFAQSGQRKFVSGAGAEVFGSTIYNLPQRPLSIQFKSKYGEEVLKYPLFEEKNNEKYTAFLLRNGGNDYNLAYFRDGLATKLLQGNMDIDYQAYQPCVVFVNGEYHGVYEMREKLDEDYIAANHDINNNNLDYIEDSLVVVTGDAHGFASLLSFIQNNDLSLPVNYQSLSEQMDIDAYLNFIIHRTFIGYRIAEHNNKYWKDKDTNGKWRWISYDMEHAFGQLSGDNYTDNTLSKLMGSSGNLPDWATLIFSRLLQNQQFRDEFIQRSAARLNTIYQPTVTLAVVDSLKAAIQAQMPRHILRWGSPASLSAWQTNVNFIKNFLQNRPEHLRQHIANEFAVLDSVWVEMRISGNGKVLLSGVLHSDTLSGGYYFKDAGISLLAIPDAGYQLLTWQGLGGNNNPKTTLFPDSDTSFTAVFAPIGISIIPPLINQDTLLSAALSPWYGVEDVRVVAGVTLTVEAGVEIKMTDKVSFYIEGGLRLQGTAGNEISMHCDAAPNARRPFYNTQPHWGAIIADNAADSIIIRYSNITGSSYGSDRDSYFATISAYNSNLHIEHSSITDCTAPLYANAGSIYIGYSRFHSFRQCNGFISLYNMNSPLVEHSTFNGNNAPDTDGIDLKGISNGIIRYNHVYNFFAPNCDGIDLGIHSLNNLVEYNQIHDCTDKGVSVGSQSDVLIRRNLIYDCDLGVAVKDSLATAFIDQNTFYGNNTAVACYEKSSLRGGGTAYVKNSILAASLSGSISLDNQSVLEVSYSLSDEKLLTGTGNLFADPQLIHPSTGNFQLQSSSPCIDSGDPASPNDPDNSRADMGAYYTHSGAFGLTVHITELHYNPPFNYPTGDWVELYNRSPLPIDLSGWSIAQGSNKFTFDNGSIINAGAYWVVCQDTSLFKSQHPAVQNIIGNLHFGWDDNQGKISLYNQQQVLVHSLRYTDEQPYTWLADGHGASIELDQNKEGNNALDWRESYVLMGTPGNTNSLPLNKSGLFINELMASNGAFIADPNGEYDDWFEVYNAGNDTIDIGGLYFTDNLALPRKWQAPLNFPQQTRIVPQGFLLFWADNQTEQGSLHTAFKLSASGESLGIFQRLSDTYAVVDSLLFGSQTNNAAWGRYPDGSSDVRVLQPTPGSSNVVNGQTFLPVPALAVYPNPFQSQIVFEAITVQKPYNIEVFNAAGLSVWQSGNTNQTSCTMPRNRLPSGFYAFRITDAQGHHYTGKIVAD